MKKPRALYLIFAIAVILILVIIPFNGSISFYEANADNSGETTNDAMATENEDELLIEEPELIEDEKDVYLDEPDDSVTVIVTKPDLPILTSTPTKNPLIEEIVMTDGFEEIALSPDNEEIEEKINYEEFIPLTNSAMEELIKDCTEKNIPLYIGLGLIDLESNFDSNSLSSSNCYGLCQLNPKYFPSNLSDEDNIRYGMTYLAENYKRYQDWTKALNAYNKGHVTGDLVYPRAVFKRASKWKQVLIEHGIDLIIDSIDEVE